jgi:hypothetical protein
MNSPRAPEHDPAERLYARVGGVTHCPAALLSRPRRFAAGQG